ncbi:MAG: sigma 54-interacting transcriptional regulator [Myxococcota bacterium]
MASDLTADGPARDSDPDLPRAFVAVKAGDRSWVADLPRGEVVVSSADDAELPIPGASVPPASLKWDGTRLSLRLLDAKKPAFLNGKRVTGSIELKPGDELSLGNAQLVVGVALPPATGGRRALTHHEFRERLYEELARAARAGRPTALAMVSAPGGGAQVAAIALDSFRAGDVVGTYAPDEIEFLLPDTDFETARSVVARVLGNTAGACAGLAQAPDHGGHPERLLRSARRALRRALSDEGGIKAPPPPPLGPREPDVTNPLVKALIEEVKALAIKPGSVLIAGEVSSGKALLGRVLHEHSLRATEPFETVSCASLDDGELATALDLGVDSPAARAQGGTLLLEEVGDLSKEGQLLLRTFVDSASDVRFVATTHRVLGALVQRGAFDQALSEALSTHRVELPALRNRPEDIIPLAERFALEAGASTPIRLSPGALARLRSYPWPGNVLELRNAMERAVRLAGAGEILAEHLPADVVPTGGGEGRLREHVDSVERDAIIKALADANHNQTHAAKKLGVSRRALIYKMEKYGLKKPPGARR